jgi:hypothetical protein
LDDEQKKWQKQYASNFGTREFIRLAVAIVAWIFLGLAISTIVGSSAIFAVFFIALFGFAIISSRWGPTYYLLRRIIGNDNLPTEPFPRTLIMFSKQPRPWWSYLPSLWWLLLDVILLVLVIRYLTK